MIPDRIKESIDAYVRERCPVGGFLNAVLSNDLYRAVRHADAGNMHRLLDIVQYVDNELPIDCYGSAAKVRRWLERHENEPEVTT